MGLRALLTTPILPFCYHHPPCRYLLSLPVAFSDFGALSDCSAASKTQFTSDVASALGLKASQVRI
jgi:hypothetical protein